MNQRDLLMMGIAETGKTTFLAALFHVVESGQIESSLQLLDLGESRDYLVYIRNKWLGCSEFERTKLGEEQVVKLKLLDTETNQEIQLSLPDISGETFRDQWEQRKSSEIFDDLARHSQGILFFVHPDVIKDAVRINKVKAVAGALNEPDSEEEERQLEESETPEPASQNQIQTEWHPRFAPTQTKLVEILQFLLREPEVYPVSHIAIIVSAWDLVKGDYQTPGDWLAKRVPMLNQFLLANSDQITYKTFGISAQGAELGEDNSELLLKFRQSERIEVVTDIENEFDQHDITAPLKWLLGERN